MSIKKLDGRKIKDINSFHKEVKTVLELPDFYGENLDALWDCLTGYIGIPTILIWENFEISKKMLGEYIYLIINVFNEAEAVIEGFKVEYC